MDEKQKKLSILIDRAYKKADATKFGTLRQNLLMYQQDLDSDTPYTTTLKSLQYDLFNADKTLPLGKRISGLPIELVQLAKYVDSQLQEANVSKKLNFWGNLRSTLSRISFYIR
ncbi:hypothetical protein ACA626_16085 [Lactiplantibacillus pentosus]|uniref:hypothetical protein n=1 Tax=Lactiplantibacillus pentosus TaxID=1589 RepID=UPI003C1F079A